MVEIIPKETEKPARGLKFLFYFAIFLLFFSISGYFLLNNFFIERAEKELASLKLDITEVMTSEKIALEKEILSARNKIDMFSYLIERRPESSKVFGIIEKVTHPKVWFNKFDFNPREKTLKVSGQTQNFESLGQQILIMEDEETIETVNLETIIIDEEGEIQFDLSLLLKPAFFNEPF